MSTKEENLLDLEEQKQQQEIQLSLDSQYLGTLGGVSFQQLWNSTDSNMAYRSEQINRLQARNWEQKIQTQEAAHDPHMPLENGHGINQ